ncbi:hypothetical protein [Butyrivibrio sp. MC2013]|uniref:hypothetical protein n=1 Tax=Butyrivibrio sp. MC2013 TaxID=1280686 RepID=UPI00042847E9|nr:hypothetical protein [Butyrivibrio sp. MC2013]
MNKLLIGEKIRKILVLTFYGFRPFRGRTGLLISLPGLGDKKFHLQWPGSVRDRNHAHNFTNWGRHLEEIDKKGGFIDNQSSFKDMRYGVNAMDYNGCGVIAVYNALNALGLNEQGKPGKPYMPDLISIFEKNGIAMAGDLGTSPYAILRFFKKRGIACKAESNKFRLEKLCKEHKAVIITVLNNRHKLGDGVHFITVTKGKKGRLQVHNIHGKMRTYKKPADILKDCGNNGLGEAILLIGV